VGLTALTAASFCVFLTLGLTFETALFGAALRATGLAALFLAGLTVFFGFAAVFLAGRRFTAFRAGALAVTALLAFGLDDDLVLTARFVFFADADLALEREADRRKPFVRLLLMWWISKGCSPMRAATGIARSLPQMRH
jgi:hypothetical protein